MCSQSSLSWASSHPIFRKTTSLSFFLSLLKCSAEALSWSCKTVFTSELVHFYLIPSWEFSLKSLVLWRWFVGLLVSSCTWLNETMTMISTCLRPPITVLLTRPIWNMTGLWRNQQERPHNTVTNWSWMTTPLPSCENVDFIIFNKIHGSAHPWSSDPYPLPFGIMIQYLFDCLREMIVAE